MEIQRTDLKFYYFAPGDIQVARVDRQCIVYFCEALQKLGVPVELVALGIKTMPGEKQAADPLDLYRLDQHFPVTILPTPRKQGDEQGWGWLRFQRYSVFAWKVLRGPESSRRLIFYTKNFGPALAFLILRPRLNRQKGMFNPLILFETHLPPRNAFQRFVLGRMDGVVSNTYVLAKEVKESFPDLSVIGTHQGVNLRLYDEIRLSKDQARLQLGLPLDKKLAVYTGKIYWGYREVEYLIQTARLAPDVNFLLVGGRLDHVERLRHRQAQSGPANVEFIGFVAPNLVQAYQMAADVLLSYYPSGMTLNRYRSPGKLFEYMASGRPIITADYPVLREILGEEMAAFIPPDSPELLAAAVQSLLRDPARAARMAELALQRVADFTWEARAKRILEFVGTLDG